jgi:hypothetical protein
MLVGLDSHPHRLWQKQKATNHRRRKEYLEIKSIGKLGQILTKILNAEATSNSEANFETRNTQSFSLAIVFPKSLRTKVSIHGRPRWSKIRQKFELLVFGV